MRTPTGFSKCADGALNNNAFQMSEHEAEKTYQRSPISAREIRFYRSATQGTGGDYKRAGKILNLPVIFAHTKLSIFIVGG